MCFIGACDGLVEGKQRESSLSEFHSLNFHHFALIVGRQCIKKGLVAIGCIDHEAELRTSGIVDPVGVDSIVDFQEACCLGCDLPVLQHPYFEGQISFLLAENRLPLPLRVGFGQRSTTALHSSTLEQQSKPIRNINIKSDLSSLPQKANASRFMLLCLTRERMADILRKPSDINFPFLFYLLEVGQVEIFYFYYSFSLLNLTNWMLYCQVLYLWKLKRFFIYAKLERGESMSLRRSALLLPFFYLFRRKN